MMTHPLDRPVWSALTSRQSEYATGDHRALRFAPDISPFAAAADDSPESLAALRALVPEQGNVILMQAGESVLPPGTVAESEAAGVQMVADRLEPFSATALIEPLTDADAPDMLALALLTKPGPFLPRTHRLGRFIGVREKGRLVAMAGERLKLDGFTEVSGVCTHPDVRGQGYARLLSLAVATRIREERRTPFLHAYASNAAAIALYEALGFVVRSAVVVTALARS